MEYFSKIKRNEGNPSIPGEKLKNEYSIRIDKNGHKAVYQSGKTNLYEKIQSHEESCRLENILKRAQLGDRSGLKEGGIYGDFTVVPTSLAERQNTIIRIQNEFNKLPIEERKKYDFSVEKFIAVQSELAQQEAEKPVENPVIKPIENPVIKPIEKPVETVEN